MSSVAIIGSGIIGLCSAIELLKTGHSVTLFDRRVPCSEASRWNAGVMATSSLMPLNNPTLFRKIPNLLTGQIPGFKFDYGSSLETLIWALRFLANGRSNKFKQTVSELHQLIQFSRAKHEVLLNEIDSEKSLKRNGWIYLYRSEDQFRSSAPLKRLLTAYGVAHDILDGRKIHALEPELMPEFYRGLHITDTFSANPSEITNLYLDYVKKLGGIILKQEILAISHEKSQQRLQSNKGDCGVFDHVVIAAGPWSNKLLKPLGRLLPMAVERGYLQTFSLKNNASINRPLYDVANGYVMSPRPGGIQISSGTELTSVGSPPSYSQIDTVIENVRTTLPVAAPTMDSPVIGNRPTLTDSKPAIGPVRGHSGLWLACGHQHIGFGTSAGTGHLLASQINKTATEIDHRPYLPSRFGI